jgi:hypothetical protein
MSLFSRKDQPAWLDQARAFCRGAGITIVGWGPQHLVVEAKSAGRSREIAEQLAPMGFTAVPNVDDAYAGLLDLSHDP